MTVIGGNEGVVVVADYEDGRLVSVKTCGLAGSVTFEDILADEIFIWKSASSMEPLCESYVIK